MRRASTWILILALVLLALCVLWLLPRLLHEEPEDPIPGIAAAGAVGGESDRALSGEGAAPAVTSESTAEAAMPTVPREVDEPQDPAHPKGSLSGRLVDRAGRPVADANVLAAHAPDLGTPVVRSDWWIAHLPLDVGDPAGLGAEVPAHSTSDPAGRFTLEGVEPGRVRFAVRSARLAPFDRGDLRLAEGESLQLGDLVLEPPAEIYGVLQDGEGRPVTSAPIVPIDEFPDSAMPPLAPSAGVQLAVSDARGGFRSSPIAPGPWSARALGGEDLVDAEMRGSSPAEGWNRLETLAEAGWIQGILSTHGNVAEDLCVRALPAETARGPVSFACRADARSGRVQRNGAFGIAGLAPGVLYEIRAGSAKSKFEDDSVWSPPTFAMPLEDGVRVRWEPEATISFALVDATDLASVAACEVELRGALPALSSLGLPTPEHAGLRVLEGVRPLRSSASASLHAASRGYMPLVQRLDLRPGKDASLGTLSMTPLPVLEVRVVDAVTRAPLRGALVTPTDPSTGLDPSDLSARAVATDAQGVVRVASFVGAASQIEVQARGYARQRRSGPFGGGFSSARLEVRLLRGANARIHVVDEAGHAVPGARVEWTEGNWSPNDVPAVLHSVRIADRPDPATSRIADADGLVVFPHLAPGRHAFHVQRWSGTLDGEWTQRELADGEAAEIELQSLARAGLDLRISDRSIPLTGVEVVLLRRSSVDSLLRIAEIENPLPPGIDARLDAGGAHAFWNLEPGTYVVVFDVPGQRLRGCREIKVHGGANVLGLELAQTALSGRVLDREKRPIAGARILLSEPAREHVLRDGIRRRGTAGATPADLFALGADHDAAVTDENGEYSLLGLPFAEPIRILAAVDSGGFGKSEPLLLLEESGPMDADIALLPAGTLEVRATTLPIAEPFFLFALPSDRQGLPRVRRMFPGGTGVLVALEPGTWDIQLAEEGARTRDRRHVEVVAGETRTVDMSVP